MAADIPRSNKEKYRRASFAEGQNDILTTIKEMGTSLIKQMRRKKSFLKQGGRWCKECDPKVALIVSRQVVAWIYVHEEGTPA